MLEYNSIVRLQSHENRTPTGRASTTATRKLVNYLAYGRGRPAHQAQRLPRGQWHDQSNQKLSHEEVLAWVQKQGKAQRFTHQLILSVKEAQLNIPEYNDALTAGGERFFAAWRMMPHSDSAYPHAHVVAFSDEEIRIKSPQFREWWLTVRQALDAQQQAHLARLEAEKAIEQAIERKAQRKAERQAEPQAESKTGHRAGAETKHRDKQTSELAVDANNNHLQETAAESVSVPERQAGLETDREAALGMDWEI